MHPSASATLSRAQLQLQANNQQTAIQKENKQVEKEFKEYFGHLNDTALRACLYIHFWIVF